MLTKILNYFRVKDWLHILGIPSLGFVYNNSFSLFSTEFISILILSSLGLAFAYSFDTNYEILKSKTQLVPSIVVFMFALVYSYFLNSTTFYLVFVGGLLILLYILPPFRLKSIPLVVTLTNAVEFSLLFLIGYSILSFPNIAAIYISIFVGIASFPAQLVHEITHLSKDKEKGLVTTPVRFGLKSTYSLIFGSLIALISWSLFLYIYGFSFLFPILSIVFSIFFYTVLKVIKNTTKTRIYIRYLSIALGLSLLFIFLFRL